MASNIRNFPNRAPRANTTLFNQERGFRFFGEKPKNPASDSYRGLLRTIDSARKPANKNIRSKLDVTDSEFSSRPTNKNRPSKPSVKSAGIAGAALRCAARFAGPVGALVSSTRPAGAGSDKPRGPTMRGNTKPSGTSTAWGGKSAPRGGPSGPPRGGPSGGPSGAGKMGSSSSQKGATKASTSSNKSYGGGGKMGSSSSQKSSSPSGSKSYGGPR